jgi:hypothetical protein
MSFPNREQIRELAGWEPPLGVVSVCLSVDPADRGGGWRVELRNEVSRMLEGSGAEHERKVALRRTAERILERFAAERRDMPRGVIGFVEVAEKPAEERWWEVQTPPPATSVCCDERPRLAALFAMNADDRPRGVLLASADLVRLLEWTPGRLQELHAWELAIFSRDWRERTAQHPADPARVQGAGSSGRDQFDQRLEHNRRRFLGECRELALAECREHGWDEILLFAAAREAPALTEPANGGAPAIRVAGDADLVSVPLGQVEARVAEAVRRLGAERQRDLVERTLGEAKGGTRASLGRRETLEALAEGRVRCLVLDAQLVTEGSDPPPAVEQTASEDGADAEALVAGALAGGAEIAAVSGDAAMPLAEAGGIAALLRY